MANMTPNQLKAAALHASVALGSLDALMQTERPKSARWNRLDGMVDAVNRYIELIKTELAAQQVFDGPVFSVNDMSNAAQLVDIVNDRIAEMYP